MAIRPNKIRVQPGIHIYYDPRNFVFDKRIIKTNWRKLNETPVKRFGLKVRRRAIHSIPKAERAKKEKTRRKPSKPGRPPKSRSPGHPLRLIYSVPINFGTAAVIGAVGFGQDLRPVPGRHEHGRTVSIAVPQRRTTRTARSKKQSKAARKHFLSGRIKSKPLPRIRKTVKYPERPFMKPALKKELVNMPYHWKHVLNTL